MKFLSFVATAAFSLYAFAAAEVDDIILATPLKRDDNTCVCLDGLTCIIKLGEPTCLNLTLTSSNVQTDGTSDASCTCPDGAPCVIKNGKQTCLKTVSRSDSCTCPDGATCVIKNGQQTCLKTVSRSDSCTCPDGAPCVIKNGKQTCLKTVSRSDSPTLSQVEDRALTCADCPAGCQHTKAGTVLCIPGSANAESDNTSKINAIEDRGLNCGGCPGACQHSASGELLCIPLGATVAARSDDVCICTNGAPCTIVDGKPTCLSKLPRNTVVCDCTVGRTCREQKQGGYLCVRNKLKRDNNVCDCPTGTTCRAKKEGGYLCISD